LGLLRKGGGVKKKGGGRARGGEEADGLWGGGGGMGGGVVGEGGNPLVGEKARLGGANPALGSVESWVSHNNVHALGGARRDG